MKRTLTMAALAAMAILVALPASTKSKKADQLELVEGSVVADKAGHDSDQELDFERLEVISTSENLELHIQTYTAWADLPDPQHARVAVKVAKAGWKTFYPHIYCVTLGDDGALVVDDQFYEGANLNSKKKKSWEGNGEVVQAELDGTGIVVTIPWTDLPHEELWLQVAAHHLSPADLEADEEEETVDETGEAVTKDHDTGAEPEAAEPEAEKGKGKKKKGQEDEEPGEPNFVGGAGKPVPSDYIPNYWQAVAATKP